MASMQFGIFVLSTLLSSFFSCRHRSLPWVPWLLHHPRCQCHLFRCVALIFVSRPALVAGLLFGPAQHGGMASHPGTHMSSCLGHKPIFLSLASMQPLRGQYSMGPLPGWCFTEPPRGLHSSMPTQVRCSTGPPRGQCSWGVSIRPISSGPTGGFTGWPASFGGTVWPATAGLTACRLVGSMLGQPP